MGKLWTILMLTVGLTHTAFAAEVFNLAVPEDAYAPYVVMNDRQEVIGGLLIDPLREALASLAVELKIHTVPIQRSRLLLENDQIDGVMHSPDWVENGDQLLWLDLGVWVEDRLYFKSDTANPPQNLQQLENIELITHMGYSYPNLEPLFMQGKAVRIDQYSGEEMIRALVGAPQGSERFMVMDSKAWQWYQQKTPVHLQLQANSFFVGCAPLQLRLANNERMLRLQPLIQEKIHRYQASDSAVDCPRAQALGDD